jgi:hypothetical protein
VPRNEYWPVPSPRISHIRSDSIEGPERSWFASPDIKEMFEAMKDHARQSRSIIPLD